MTIKDPSKIWSFWIFFLNNKKSKVVEIYSNQLHIGENHKICEEITYYLRKSSLNSLVYGFSQSLNLT